jgi:DEAD/DEAH box helicase domain-containing protein
MSKFRADEYTLHDFQENIAAVHTIPVKEAAYADFPENFPSILINFYRSKGIQSLYSHQLQAFELLQKKQNVVISTGTSSGKSLIYQASILQQCLTDPESTALLLYPTKALANDQLAPFQEVFDSIGERAVKKKGKAAIYDGDTSQSERIAIRNSVSILLTNPDMLHLSMLPHHTMWKRFFSHLRFIIIDEVHIYKGVFGSHFANVIRRLKRIIQFYGGDPVFICTSATIHDPRAFVEELLECPFSVVDEDGSAHGEKQVFFYNPPIVDENLSIRRGILEEGLKIAILSIQNSLQTLVFVRARRSVEIMLRRAKEILPSGSMVGYRSGYLAAERRKIEQGLKNGEIACVVATNALELGIDIGGMDRVILLGYPGTIASFIQQIGRAGRKTNSSSAIFVASMGPLDQFILQNPAYILENTPEQPLIDPQNLLILFNQLRCAAYELPFQKNDHFGKITPEILTGYLDILCLKGDLVERENKYYWIGEDYPAADISIRSISTTPFDLLLQEHDSEKKIGEVDGESVMWMAHPGAIYLQEGESYLVQDLVLDQHKVFLVKGDFPYYTNPKEQQEIAIQDILESQPQESASFIYGNVTVTSQVVGYDKLDWSSSEIIETIGLDLPPSDLSTQAFWMVISEKTVGILRKNALWFSDPNDYGKNWDEIRLQIMARDNQRCSLCGRQENAALRLHVHHKKPFRTFSNPAAANDPSNLITLCELCHQRVEQTVRIHSGLSGLGYIFSHLAPLYLMCDLRDLGLFVEPRWKPAGFAPVIMLYDAFPGGIGLSDALYRKYTRILEDAQVIIKRCGCSWGCPACVGPVNQEFLNPKEATLALLQEIIQAVK